MKTETYIKVLLSLLLLPVCFSSCLSTANIADLPRSAKAIDFSRYSNEYHETKEPFWTTKTSNEYYFERDVIIDEAKLVALIKTALVEKNYRITLVDSESNYIVGKRGMQANEWSSLTGVYYNWDDVQKRTQVYIRTVITQDATGGWRENRAKKIGVIIEQRLGLSN